MKRFITFTRALALIHLRNRTVLFWNLLLPLLMLVLYGVVFNGGAFTTLESDSFSYID